MKKIVKIFSLIAILVLVVTCTSCSSTKNYVEGKKYNEFTTSDKFDEANKAETDKIFVGFFYFDEEKPGDSVLYTKNVPADKQDKVVAMYVTQNEKLSGEGYSLPKLPTGLSLGANFSGWFVKDSNGDLSRITTVAQAKDATDGVVYTKYISYGEGGLVVLICMIIVFLMLALLWGIVALFKFISPKKKEENKDENANVVLPQVEPTKPFTMEDITDDDMMAAALVATIDYHNEIHEDVRVISIKEIK